MRLSSALGVCVLVALSLADTEDRETTRTRLTTRSIGGWTSVPARLATGAGPSKEQ